jgi:hypothetical protein
MHVVDALQEEQDHLRHFAAIQRLRCGWHKGRLYKQDGCPVNEDCGVDLS